MGFDTRERLVLGRGGVSGGALLVVGHDALSLFLVPVNRLASDASVFTGVPYPRGVLSSTTRRRLVDGALLFESRLNSRG